MKRRFRPTLGGLVLENKGKLANATTSTDSPIAAQPTRRARFKPTVGIVKAPAQHSPVKASKQTKVPTSASQPSTSTKTSNKSVGDQPSTGIGTLLVNKDGSIGQQTTGNRTSTSPVNTDGCSQPSAGTNKNTVNKNAGNDKDIVTATVCNQSLDDTRTGTSPVNRNVHNQSLIGQVSTDAGTGTELVNKNGDSQPSAVAKTSPLPAKNVANQLSSGSNIDCVSGQISTSTNKDTVATSAGSQPSVVTRTDTSVCPRTPHNEVQPNTSVPTRRARIKPRVGIIAAKTPAVTISSPKTSVGLTSITSGIETENVCLSKKTTSADHQPFTNLMSPTETPTDVQPLKNTNTENENVNTCISEKHSSIAGQPLNSTNTESASSDKSTATPAITQPTRRARFKPRVGNFGRLNALTQKIQSQTSNVNKPARLNSTNLAGSDAESRQNLAVTHGKETFALQKTVSHSSVNIENEQNKNVTGDDTPVGAESITLLISDNVEQPEPILPSRHNQAAVTSQQTTSSACEELSDRTLKTAQTDSNVVQNEAVETSTDVISQNYLSSELLHGSLQDNEGVLGTQDSASPQIGSCLPVMMEDSSILHKPDITPQISSVLSHKETPELSTQMTAVVTDNDFTQSLQPENADNLLQMLLSTGLLQILLGTGNLGSDYVPQRNSGSGIPMDNRTTSLEVQADPGKSILTTPSLSTRVENETRISSQISQAQTPASEAKLQSNELDSTLNESRKSAQNNQSTTTSRLVTKRRRGKPRNKQRIQPIEIPDLDISTIPIASNIEIEPVCASDDVDHPVLELPVDLIQEDISQNTPKSSILSGGLKQRFEQRRSGTVKLVLSRKRSESTDMEKMNESGSTVEDISSTAEGGISITEDTSSPVRDRSSTEGNSNAAGDNSASQNSANKVVADKSKEVTRRARVAPNILVQRKTSKPNDQKKPTSENMILAGKTLELESHSSHERGTISVDLMSSRQDEGGKGTTLCSPRNLVSRQENQIESDKTVNRSNDLDTTHERANIPPSIEEREEVRKQSIITDESLVDLSDGFQFEVEVGNNELEITNSGENLEIQDDVSTTLSVKDLSKDCEVEIVLEVRGGVDTVRGGVDTVRGGVDTVRGGVDTVKGGVDTVKGGVDTARGGVDTVRGGVDTVYEKSNIVSSMQQNCTAVNLSDVAARDKIISEKSSGFANDRQVDECHQSSNEVARTDNAGAKRIVSDTESTDTRNDTSLDISASSSECKDISTDGSGRKGTDSISSTQAHGMSLNVSESVIEEAICSTTGPLPDVVECPECPDIVLCLTTVDDTSVNDQEQDVSQTQPGTLEDNVAKATRRASGEFQGPLNNASCGKTQTTNEVNSDTKSVGNEKGVDFEKESLGKKGETSKPKSKEKATIQRKRNVRGKKVDNDESGGITDSNQGPTQDIEGDSQTGNDVLGEQDESLGDACIQADTTQDSGVLDVESTLEVPNDPTLDLQDGSSKKSSSRKRQGKAVKPKIPAKRSRKNTAVPETKEAGDVTELGVTDAPDGETRSTIPTTVPGTDEATNSQKRKRGRPKGSKKTATETSKETETAPVEKTPRKKRKGPRGKRPLDAVVNIASMRMCDMISYNPVTNPMTSPNEDEPQSSLLSGISCQSRQPETVLPANEDQPEENSGAEATTDVCAPRVTIDADGNIVLDEESLVIQSTPVPENLDKNVVFENANQQYQATHKRKNKDRWNKEETLLFYEVLSQTGTDFSLMEKVFTTEKIKRNRTELKKKFKREEKANRDLIDKALSQRIPLAASLFADCLEETEEEMERSLVVETAATETAAQA